MVRFISGDIYINFFRKELSIFKLIAFIWEKKNLIAKKRWGTHIQQYILVVF